MHLLALLAMLAMLVCVPHAGWAASDHAPPPQCPAAAGYDLPAVPLHDFGTAVKSGRSVELLALGSASTVAHGDSGFLYQMLGALRAMLPRVTFRLTVHGHRGMTATEGLDELRTALAGGHFALVLWQTGTVEAVRGARPEELASDLEEGAELITAQGGNLILIDPQFSRFLRANTNLRPYSQAMLTAATVPGVDLFHRFDLMHDWVAEGAIDLERTPRAEVPAAVEQLHHCLGEALARFLLAGIGQ